jgi:N-glycosylase/DNA lyase
LIKDDRSRNFHDAALAVACSRYRILRAGDEWYEKFNRLTEKEA